MLADQRVAEAWLRVWGWSISGRSELSLSRSEIIAMRAEAQKLQNLTRPNSPVSEWVDVLERRAGYRPAPIPSDPDPYTGPKPHGLLRLQDDPDPRLFVVVTVDRCLLRLRPESQSLAWWVYGLGKPATRFECGWSNPRNQAHRAVRELRAAVARHIGAVEDPTVVESLVKEILRELRRKPAGRPSNNLTNFLLSSPQEPLTPKPILDSNRPKDVPGPFELGA